MKLKYILVELGHIPTPIMFPDHIGHDEMARMIGGKVLSAGFVSGDELIPHGKSVSLGIEHNEEGKKAFNRLNEAW